MSNPTKFNMGGVPRTSTGLVPASYRQQMDTMSNPNQWSPLPKKPKPVMYPYRGDYINKRNKQTLDAKKSTKKQQHHSYDGDGIGRTFSTSHAVNTDTKTNSAKPRELIQKQSTVGNRMHRRNKSINSKVSDNQHFIRPQPPNSDSETDSPTWDSYCKHDSCHKFSAEEDHARTQNKKVFLSYLRSEASKRRAREKLEKKLHAEVQKENVSVHHNKDKKCEAELSKPERKPLVPRLSWLARSKPGSAKSNKKDTLSKDEIVFQPKLDRNLQVNGQKPPIISNSDHLKSGNLSGPKNESSSNKIEKNDGKSTEPSNPKLKYLDFISKKIEKPAAASPKTNSSLSKTSSDFVASKKVDLDKPDNTDASVEDKNEEDIFRKQIERIVKRAAEMVIEERRHAERDMISSKEASSSEADTSRKSSSIVEVETAVSSSPAKDKHSSVAPICVRLDPGANLNMHAKTTDLQDRLYLLEERVKSVASPRSLFSEREKVDRLDNGQLLEAQKTKRTINGRYFIATRDHLVHSSDSSQISGITEDFHLPQMTQSRTETTECNNHSQISDEYSSTSCFESECDSSTEVMPRMQIHPMNPPARRPLFDHYSKPKEQFLYSIDEYSNTTSNPSFPTMSFDDSTHCETVSHQIDTRMQHQDVLSNGAGSFCNTKESFSEKVSIHRQVIEICPEEAQIPTIYPSDVPSRPVEWEEEPPQPRGHKVYKQLYSQMSNQNEKSEVLAEDLFSLL